VRRRGVRTSTFSTNMLATYLHGNLYLQDLASKRLHIVLAAAWIQTGKAAHSSPEIHISVLLEDRA